MLNYILELAFHENDGVEKTEKALYAHGKKMLVFFLY